MLTLHCELVEQRGPVGIGKASAYVDGKCAAPAELTFVPVSYTHLDVYKRQAGGLHWLWRRPHLGRHDSDIQRLKK